MAVNPSPDWSEAAHREWVLSMHRELFPAEKHERCPAYGHQCDCPATSAVRRICERTAADKR